MTNPIKYARKALAILEGDSERLERIDKYFIGDHLKPYMPASANEEYRDLAERCITNWMPNLVGTPAQALFVDNFTRDASAGVESVLDSPGWLHWKRSGLDGGQAQIYDSALKFGHAFAVTERDRKGHIITKGLSALRTVALYEDKATDLDPKVGVYFRKFATGSKASELGHAIIWDEKYRYEYAYDMDDRWTKKANPVLHGASQCPLTRFHAYRDLEGRTWGVIEPMIPIQDRINQTIFDLLVSQTYSSFTVRYVTGMAPPIRMKMDPVTQELVPDLDENGLPQPDRQVLNASRWFYAEDENVKFGDLDGADLTGFIKAAELAVRHLSALSQTPPHFLLGEIANISAEALEAAETALSRKVEAFRTSFGESWERVMRVAAEIGGDVEAANDFSGEVVWRDMGASSLAKSADALGKFAQSLDIPRRGLWGRVPKVSKAELAYWERLRQEDDYERQLIEASTGPRPLGPSEVSGAARPSAFGSSARQAVTGDGSSTPS